MTVCEQKIRTMHALLAEVAAQEEEVPRPEARTRLRTLAAQIEAAVRTLHDAIPVLESEVQRAETMVEQSDPSAESAELTAAMAGAMQVGFGYFLAAWQELVLGLREGLLLDSHALELCRARCSSAARLADAGDALLEQIYTACVEVPLAA